MTFNANDEHRRVSQYQSDGNYVKALDLARRWIERCPEDVNAHVMAAITCRSLEDNALAIAFCKRALELSPCNMYALIHIAAAHSPDDLDQALIYAEEVVRHHPRQAESYITRGWVKARQGNLDEADQDCDEARKFGATLERSRALNEYTALKRHKISENDCQNVVQQTASDAPALVWRARAKAMLYDFTGSIEDCEKAIELKSCVSQARLQRSYTNIAINNFHKADEDYRILFNETSETAYFKAHVLLLKSSLLECNRYLEDALAACNRAMKLKTGWVDAILAKAGLLSSLHRSEDALLILEELRPLHLTEREQASALSTKARTLVNHDDVAGALRDSNVAMEMNPGDAWINSNHGHILTRAGQLDEAEKVLNSAISINKYAREAYWFRHELLKKQGNGAQSAADRKVAENFGYKPYI